MSDVFQEVDEELKRQKIDQALRRYGPLVASVVIAGGAIYGAYLYWQNQIDQRASVAAEQMIVGMEALGVGSAEAAATIFAGIADNAPGEYPVFARFNEASALRQAGDSASALSIYDEIAADGSTPAPFGELAAFYGGLTVLDNSAALFEDVEMRLAPVAEGNTSFRHHAQELLAFAAYQGGMRSDAADRYRALVSDPEAPAGVAARANEMLSLAESAD